LTRKWKILRGISNINFALFLPSSSASEPAADKKANETEKKQLGSKKLVKQKVATVTNKQLK